MNDERGGGAEEHGRAETEPGAHLVRRRRLRRLLAERIGDEGHGAREGAEERSLPGELVVAPEAFRKSNAPLLVIVLDDAMVIPMPEVSALAVITAMVPVVALLALRLRSPVPV